MYRTHTVSVGIAVAPRVVYAYASDPANLPTWAPGMISSIEKRGGHWVAQTPLGEVKVKFALPNELGVLDHDVILPDKTFHNPMRVVPNGVGSEVLFTVVQFPGVTDAQFDKDLDTVRADLNKMRTVLERQRPARTGGA